MRRVPNKTASEGDLSQSVSALVSSLFKLQPPPSRSFKPFLPSTSSLAMAPDTPLPPSNEKATVQPSSRTNRSPHPPPAFITRFFSPSLARGWRLSTLKTLIRCILVFAAGHVLIFTQTSLILLGQAAFFCGESESCCCRARSFVPPPSPPFLRPSLRFRRRANSTDLVLPFLSHRHHHASTLDGDFPLPSREQRPSKTAPPPNTTFELRAEPAPSSLPSSYPSPLKAVTTLLVGMLLGWAWGCASMAASLSVRNSNVVAAQYQRAQTQ